MVFAFLSDVGLGGLGLAAVGAALAWVGMAWGKFKAVAQRASGLIIRYEHYEATTDLRDAVLTALLEELRLSSNYVRWFGTVPTRVQYEDSEGVKSSPWWTQAVHAALGHRALVFWSGWFPVFYIPEGPKQQSLGGRSGADGSAPARSNFGPTPESPNFQLVYLRGTFDTERALGRAAELLQSGQRDTHAQSRNVVLRFPNEGDEATYASPSVLNRPWYQSPLRKAYQPLSAFEIEYGHDGREATDELIFPEEVRTAINEIRVWRKSRQRYAQMGATWKRGLLLYGPPGTGKTALVRALGRELGMPVLIFDLSLMSNQQFRSDWNNVQCNLPCIVLFEDFDNVFKGRENITPAARSGMPMEDDRRPVAVGALPPQPVQFDTFLNCLDGIEEMEGMLAIVTTNRLEHIDPALGIPVPDEHGRIQSVSSRPGRLDRALELTYMQPEHRLELVGRLLGSEPKARAQVEYYYKQHPDLQTTPSQVRERCMQAALQAFWGEQQGERHGGQEEVGQPSPRNVREVEGAGAGRPGCDGPG